MGLHLSGEETCIHPQNEGFIASYSRRSYSWGKVLAPVPGMKNSQ